MKKNILVFPCGSEIALEIYRSVNKSTHFNLIGANSINDHGKFVYENYIEGIPFITDSEFIPKLKEIVLENKIDAIYPAMDSVIEKIKSNEAILDCKVIASSAETTKICLSKTLTYNKLKSNILTPHVFSIDEEIKEFPVFAKPDIGYGSRGAQAIFNSTELKVLREKKPSLIISEYLPGDEYTIDCFTDKNGKMIFAYPRERARIMNGISVNTKPVKGDTNEFFQVANKINSIISFRGAWFFQVKRNKNNELTLLEIASRLGGSSSLFRAKGVNFALMSLFDAFDIPVSILENQYDIEMDRALDNKYKLSLTYNEVFVDFDDCLYLEKQYINTDLMAFLYRCINKHIKITLLSRHNDSKLEHLDVLLKRLRIQDLFDRVIHIPVSEKKIDYIDNLNSIFIDDSFAERKAVYDKYGISVFSVDMVEAL